jgi:CheY-like chemotaxis protein
MERCARSAARVGLGGKNLSASRERTIGRRPIRHKVPFGYLGPGAESRVPEWGLVGRFVGAIVLGMTRMRVLVAENHPSVRENLRYLINAEPDMECVGVAKNGRQCIELCRELLPEILVVDEILPGADGLAIAAIIGNRLPQIRVVMYTFNPKVCEVARGMGAAGCVVKDTPYRVLLGALRQAAPAPALRAH